MIYMIRKEETKRDTLFDEIKVLVESLDLVLIDVRHSGKGENENLEITVSKKDSAVTTDDLEKAYRLIYPRYEVLLNNRDLSLSLMSPGVGRNIKSIDELKLFTGKEVKLYLNSTSSWTTGCLSDFGDNSLTLLDVKDELNGDTDCLSVDFDDILKAKLL